MRRQTETLIVSSGERKLCCPCPARLTAAIPVSSRRSLWLMVVRCRVIVHGRVHGVGFRAFVSRAAQSRGVSGWVRNRVDGTVEVVVEGDRKSVV